MIRYFCDCCNKEITKEQNVVSNRINKWVNLDGTNINVEIYSGINNSCKGHLCFSCFAKAFQKLVKLKENENK